jgi:hypothetical protein
MIETTDTHAEEVEQQSEAMRRSEDIRVLEHALEDIANFSVSGVYQEINARLNDEYSKAFNQIIILSRNGRREEAAHLLGFIEGLGMAMGMLGVIELDIKRKIDFLHQEDE